MLRGNVGNERVATEEVETLAVDRYGICWCVSGGGAQKPPSHEPSAFSPLKGNNLQRLRGLAASCGSIHLILTPFFSGSSASVSLPDT